MEILFNNSIIPKTLNILSIIISDFKPNNNLSNGIIENSIWLLGNIVGEDNKYKNYLLNNCDVINNHIMPMWKLKICNSTISVLTWFTTNLIRGTPNLPNDYKIVPILENSLTILDTK